jgi:hypothetical protein
MKLINLIEYLVNPHKLDELYLTEKLNTDSEALLIYMQGALDLASEIKFFAIEETGDHLVYEKDGVQYEQLFPIDYAIELIESDLDLKGKGYSNLQIAKRLLEYRIKDA